MCIHISRLSQKKHIIKQIRSTTWFCHIIIFYFFISETPAINCCDPLAACSCGTHTGHFACVCPAGYYGRGLIGDCKRAYFDLLDCIYQTCCWRLSVLIEYILLLFCKVYLAFCFVVRFFVLEDVLSYCVLFVKNVFYLFIISSIILVLFNIIK